MRILLVNQGQTQNQNQTPRIQELQIQPSLLDQSQPGQHEAEQVEEYQEDSSANYEDTNEFYDDYSYENTDY